jgi:hypothetical protein
MPLSRQTSPLRSCPPPERDPDVPDDRIGFVPPPPVLVPDTDAVPPLRVLLAVGDPERERRLLDGLGTGGLSLAGRCLDAASLAAVAQGDADVVLASTSLHRLTPATLLAVRQAGLPVVLLADPDSLARYRDTATVTVLPLDAPFRDVRDALADAAGRGTRPRSLVDADHGADGDGGARYDAAPRQVIALTGGKGAPGVTTLAVALASALAGRGRRVLLVDLDLRLGAVGAHLDLDPRRGLFTFAYGPRGGREDWSGRCSGPRWTRRWSPRCWNPPAAATTTSSSMPARSWMD